MTQQSEMRERLFVSALLADPNLNATEAAIQAGYAPRTANRTGSRLLTRADIQTTIEQAMDRRAKRTEVKADRVVLELARIAFTNAQHVAAWDGDGVTIKPSDELDEDTHAAVKEVRNTRTTTVTTRKSGEETVTERVEQRVTMHSKIDALELLAKHTGVIALGKPGSGPMVIAGDYVAGDKRSPEAVLLANLSPGQLAEAMQRLGPALAERIEGNVIDEEG